MANNRATMHRQIVDPLYLPSIRLTLSGQPLIFGSFLLPSMAQLRGGRAFCLVLSSAETITKE